MEFWSHLFFTTHLKYLLLLEPLQMKIYFNDKYFTNVILLNYLDLVTILTIVGIITYVSYYFCFHYRTPYTAGNKATNPFSKFMG